MDLIAILTVTSAFIVYGLISGRIRESMFTGPMLFAAGGLVAGPALLGLVPVDVGHEGLHTLAEITLILVLFADAASIDLEQLRRDHDLPVRMLLLGMPLSIALGTAAAVLIFTDFGPWEAALLAAILAPTDAALGQAVVSNRAVPVRIRQALNVESGLNDGVALPFVLIFASLAGAGMASASAEVGDPTDWLTFGAMQVVLGPLAGALVGYVGAKAVAFCYRKGWMAMSAEGIVALALAFTSFGFAELVHGNGFIAAFVAGLVFGNTLKQKCEFLYEFTETEGTILVLATFMAFGGAMIPEAWGAVTVAHLGFALVALTLVRILPVFLSLLGTGLRPATWGFLGWFGPRGLASVLFVLLVLERVEVPNEAGIFAAVVVTVALSIVLHGVTAVPAARRYAEMAREMGPCEENMPVSEEPFTGAMRGPGR